MGGRTLKRCFNKAILLRTIKENMAVVYRALLLGRVLLMMWGYGNYYRFFNAKFFQFQVKKIIAKFLGGNRIVRDRLIRRLKDIQSHFEQSPFFKKHEVCYDSSGVFYSTIGKITYFFRKYWLHREPPIQKIVDSLMPSDAVMLQ